MKTGVSLFFAFVTIFSVTSFSVASADTCALEFTAKGRDLQILVGYSHLKGKGLIKCVDDHRRSTALPIRVTFKTPILFPRFSLSPTVTVHGVASGIQVPPETRRGPPGGAPAILGSYLTVNATAAVGEGAGTSLDLQGEDNQTPINLKLENIEGFGVAIGATQVTFSR